MSRKLCVTLLWIFFGAFVLLVGIGEPVQSQELVTSTPVRISIPTLAPPPLEVVSTVTATFTPTVAGRAVLEAKPDAGEVNVRADADIESDKLGTIRAGDQYPVLGKYFRWYQFQFDLAPSGRGWVFDELVDIIGDVSTIPDLSVEALPTDDPTIVAATATQAALTQTPGGILTATENSRLLPLPGQATISTSGINPGEGDSSGPLPTFTFPPDVVAIAPTSVDASQLTPTASPDLSTISVEDGVPPIVPILALGGLGLLGLAVSSMRR